MLGFHLGNGGNHNGWGEYCRRLTDAGLPLFAKAVDAYGPLTDALALGGVCAFRLSTAGQADGYDYDVPPYHLPPADAARHHWRRTLDRLPPEFDRFRVWLEPINEVDKMRADWLGQFAVALAELSLADGFRITLPAWSSGEPEPGDWQSFDQYLRLAADFPDDLAVAVHEYNFDMLSWEHAYPWHFGRFQDLFYYCDRAGIGRPTLHLTEWGWARDHLPEPSQLEPQLRQALRLYWPHAQIQGAAIWCLQSYQGSIHNDANRLMRWLADWLPAQPIFDEERYMDAPLDPNHYPATPPAGGTRYAVQPFGDPLTDQRRVYFAPVGEWSQVRWTDGTGSELERSLFAAGMAMQTVSLNREAALQRAAAADGFYLLGSEGRATVDVPPAPDVLDATPYSQRDPRWANVTLGQDTGHGETIGSWGCLLVAYTMQVQQLGIDDPTPDALNRRMVEAGAFSRQYIQPGALRTAYPTRVIYDGYMRRDNPAMAPTIRQWLDDGYSVPVRVDFRPATAAWEQHWCLVIGGTADNWIVADPWTGEIGPLADVYGIAGEDVLEAVFYRPRPEAPPPPPPAGDAVDLLPYLLPHTDRHGPTYELRRPDGSQERVQVQAGVERRFYVTKGTGGLLGRSEWELLRYDDQYIWRGMDTSPGGGRYYTQREPGQDMARWCPRRMVPGVWWQGPGHHVQFYDKATCSPSDPNSGPAVNRMVLASANDDEVVLTNGTETWRYRRGVGMVGWTAPWGASELSELHPPGARPDNVREVIPCADAPPGEVERYR